MTKTLLHLSEFLSFIGVISVLILAYGLLGVILWTMMWGLHYLIT
jgi:hypothetical protein